MNWKGPCWLIPKSHYTRTVFLFFFTHLWNCCLLQIYAHAQYSTLVLHLYIMHSALMWTFSCCVQRRASQSPQAQGRREQRGRGSVWVRGPAVGRRVRPSRSPPKRPRRSEATTQANWLNTVHSDGHRIDRRRVDCSHWFLLLCVSIFTSIFSLSLHCLTHFTSLSLFDFLARFKIFKSSTLLALN